MADAMGIAVVSVGRCEGKGRDEKTKRKRKGKGREGKGKGKGKGRVLARQRFVAPSVKKEGYVFKDKGIRAAFSTQL